MSSLNIWRSNWNPGAIGPRGSGSKLRFRVKNDSSEQIMQFYAAMPYLFTFDECRSSSFEMLFLRNGEDSRFLIEMWF